MMLSSSLALAALSTGCQQPQGAQEANEEPVAVTQQAETDDNTLLKQCGLVCADKGIVDGNASISGVASVDSFFQAVLDFQAKANNVSAGIDAQLAAIKGDFGIDANTSVEAGLSAAIDANVEGELTVDAEPAKCQVDAEATIQAQAKCDVDVKPGMASVKCEGSCQVDASADVSCSADADLECTVQAPSVACSGECSGSCDVEVDGSASCDGECHGECSGNCSAYVKDGSGAAQCAGSCDGTCKGSCKAHLAAAAKCDGKCEGECKLTNPPKAMCEGAIKAECKAHANAMVECKGHCDGNIEPPSAKADCQASAKAEAKVNVECTPPRVAISYKLKAGVDAMAQAKFVAGIKNLEVRLPALLASIKKAGIVAEAGAGLVGDGKVAVTGAVNTALKGDVSLRAKVGLTCAITQLDDVGKAVKSSSDKLAGSISASGKVTAALGV
jgi:hypothetical protein